MRQALRLRGLIDMGPSISHKLTRMYPADRERKVFAPPPPSTRTFQETPRHSAAYANRFALADGRADQITNQTKTAPHDLIKSLHDADLIFKCLLVAINSLRLHKSSEPHNRAVNRRALTPTTEPKRAMVEATPSISRHTPLTIAQHVAMATMTRAMQLSRGVVKDQLKRQKIRLADVDARKISERARDYLVAHPELVAEARLCVEAWFSRGVFGKRAQRAKREGLIHKDFDCAISCAEWRTGNDHRLRQGQH